LVSGLMASSDEEKIPLSTCRKAEKIQADAWVGTWVGEGKDLKIAKNSCGTSADGLGPVLGGLEIASGQIDGTI
jgi:hypothetical protein